MAGTLHQVLCTLVLGILFMPCFCSGCFSRPPPQLVLAGVLGVLPAGLSVVFPEILLARWFRRP